MHFNPRFYSIKNLIIMTEIGIRNMCESIPDYRQKFLNTIVVLRTAHGQIKGSPSLQREVNGLRETRRPILFFAPLHPCNP